MKNRAVEIVETMRFAVTWSKQFLIISSTSWFIYRFVVDEFFPDMRPALTDIFVDYDPKRYKHLEYLTTFSRLFISFLLLLTQLRENEEYGRQVQQSPS